MAGGLPAGLVITLALTPPQGEDTKEDAIR
jgi:hypothetical protein